MITANFKLYGKIVTDSLHQWDTNQMLTVSGMDLPSVPEVHFSNSAMDAAIVRQATMMGSVLCAEVPNTVLQHPLRIYAHIGIYEGDTFKIVEEVQIPVIPRKRPRDYTFEDTHGEIYSHNKLKNMLANAATKAEASAISARVSTLETNAATKAEAQGLGVRVGVLEANAATKDQVANIVAGVSSDAELVDVRYGADGMTYASAGEAVREQVGAVVNDMRLADIDGLTTLSPHAGWKVGGLTNGEWSYQINRIMTTHKLRFDRDITLKIAGGFRMGVHTFDDAGAFLADSGWKFEEHKIPAGTSFRVVVARVTETNETPSILEFSSAVTLNTRAETERAKMSKRLDHVEHVTRTILGEVIDVTGDYFTTNNEALTPNNRIRANDIRCEKLAIIEVLDKSSGHRYGVDLFTNDGNRTLISESGWMNLDETPFYVVDQNCLVNLVIAKQTSTPFDSLDEMDGIFRVYTYNTVADLQAVNKNANKYRKAWLTSAHRGLVEGVLRENSLAAYYNAYLQGADMIETDARMAADGVLVVNHDATVVGLDEAGQQVTYTVADTPSTTLCSVLLSNEKKWGLQYVPTLAQVLHLAYNTGLQVNIDLKDGLQFAATVAKLVLEHGMQGRVVYALNGSGMEGINVITAIDPDARFIASAPGFVTQVEGYAERGKRCFAYTSDISAEAVKAIRDGGCMVALIGLNEYNFETALAYHPDMCEFVHTANFREIEDQHFDSLKLY